MINNSDKARTSTSFFSLFLRIWHHIAHRRRVQLGIMSLLMILTSFSEVISIGMTMPFLGVLTTPERFFENSYMKVILAYLDVKSPSQLLFPVTLIFILATLLAGVTRLLFLWASVRFSYSMGADLKVVAYQRTLYQPYEVHASRNSSDIIVGVGKAGNIIIYFTNTLNAVSSGFLVFTILSALLIVNAGITLVLFGGFGVIYALITRFTKDRLLQNSRSVARESSKVLKAMQEGLGGIRDVLIDGTQNIYSSIFRNADLSLNRAQGNSLFLSSSPSLAIQSLSIILIAVLSFTLTAHAGGLAPHLPLLGALVYGAQRLLPALQQLYSSWSTIQGMRGSLDDALDLLDQPLPEYATLPPSQPLPFKENITLHNLSFRYSTETPWVLKHIELTVQHGNRIGFIGTTGSGKSTLLDIVMGLLKPTSGMIAIDGQSIDNTNTRAWQSHIAHVPQSIFLSDATIAENIAFGIPFEKIDQSRLKRAASHAQIADLIDGWPKKYKTFVGERGIRLSGGQRQRIGIARALYKQADVIIFDEATSALDNETEKAVMEAIEGLGDHLTILIIAHRLTTLKKCTQIVELSDGGIKRIGTYDEIISEKTISSKRIHTHG